MQTVLAARARAFTACHSWLQALEPSFTSPLAKSTHPPSPPPSCPSFSICSPQPTATQPHNQGAVFRPRPQHSAWATPAVPSSPCHLHTALPATQVPPSSIWSHMLQLQTQQVRHMATALSRVRVPKSVGFNDTVMPNTTTLKHGMYGIRALTGKRVAANTIEAVRRTLRRRLKKTAALWVRIEATVPVTRKPEGIRMGKGKGAIEFYACPVRPGQIIFEMDRVPRKVALSALEAIQPKFPCRLSFVEWN